MATIRRRNGKYQVQIRHRGRASCSRTFIHRGDAKRWARQTEVAIDNGTFANRLNADITLATLLDRYIDTVVPQLKSPRQERDRARLMQTRLGASPVAAINNALLAQYRDARLTEVAPQTVKHEINLIRRVLKVAVGEWGLELPKGIPAIRSPRLPTGRTRRVTAEEWQRLINTLPQPTLDIAVLAIETALRRGELLAIHHKHIDWDRRWLTVPVTKNGVPRVVPLTERALTVLNRYESKERLFAVAPDSVTQAFSRACQRSDIVNLRFHDLRHEAISRFFEQGRSVPEVASISGHADYRMLARYTHLQPASRIEQRKQRTNWPR